MNPFDAHGSATGDGSRCDRPSAGPKKLAAPALRARIIRAF